MNIVSQQAHIYFGIHGHSTDKIFDDFPGAQQKVTTSIANWWSRMSKRRTAKSLTADSSLGDALICKIHRGDTKEVIKVGCVLRLELTRFGEGVHFEEGGNDSAALSRCCSGECIATAVTTYLI